MGSSVRLWAVASGVLSLACAAACGNQVADGPHTSTEAVTRPAGALVFAEDPADDVALTGQKGLPDRLRRGIDLRSLAVTPRADGVRITVQVRRVDRSSHFSQIFFVDLDAVGFDAGQLQVATHPLSDSPGDDGLEHSIVLEGAHAAEGYVECDGLAASLEDGADAWWVDVPRRCLPATPTTLRIHAQTAPTLQTESTPDQWSHDTLRVPGRHELGGTVRPGR